MKSIPFNELLSNDKLDIGLTIRNFLSGEGSEFSDKHIPEIICKLGSGYHEIARMNRRTPVTLHFWVQDDVGQIGSSFNDNFEEGYSGYQSSRHTQPRPTFTPIQGYSSQALADVLEHFLLTQFRQIHPVLHQFGAIDPLALMDEIKVRLRNTQFRMPAAHGMSGVPGMVTPVSAFDRPNGQADAPGYGLSAQNPQEQSEDEGPDHYHAITFDAGETPEAGVANLLLEATKWSKKPQAGLMDITIVTRATAEVARDLCDREKVKPEVYDALEKLVFYVVVGGPKLGEWGVSIKYPRCTKAEMNPIMSGKV